MNLKKALMGESRKDRFKSVPKKIKDGAKAWHFSFMDDRTESKEKLPIFIIGPKRIELDEKKSCQGEIQREGDTFYLSYLRGGVKLNDKTQKTIANGFKRAGLSDINLHFTDQQAPEEEHHQHIPQELRAVPPEEPATVSPAVKEARGYIGNWDRWVQEFGTALIMDDRDKHLARWLQELSQSNCADVDETSVVQLKKALYHFRENVILIKAERKAQAGAGAGAGAAAAGAGAAAAGADMSDYQDTGVPPRPQTPDDPDYQG